MVNGVESPVHTPDIGVPQGSVVDPILFTMYSSPLEDIINAHNMSGMCYADDTQIYLRFKPCDLQKAIQKVECCIKHIKQWCTLNNLKLNDEKTEVLHITSRFRSRLQLPTIKVDNSPIVPSDKVKNLEVIFDRHMVMDRFVSLKYKSASFQLHRLGKIRQYLDTTTAKKLVQALVLCHLDYCNSLLYNMPDSQLGKLQIIQNSAARLITGTNKNTHQLPRFYNSYIGYQLNLGSHLKLSYLLFNVCTIWLHHTYTRTVKQVHTYKKSQIITEKSSRMSSFRH